MNSEKKVLVIGLGGTFAMEPDKEGVLRPSKNMEQILEIVPLRKWANVSLLQIENLDSTNVNPNHWTKLILKIQENHGSYDAIIIIHGTDTMSYTAGAVSIALGRGLKIPVIFTGSQLPLISFGTDARANLERAMQTAIKASDEKIAEVMIVFDAKILRANRAIKTSEAKFFAFDSPAFTKLGWIDAGGVHFIPDAFRADENTAFEVMPHFQRGILSIDLAPGCEPGIIEEVLRSGACKGILLKSLGAGNVPDVGEYSIIPVIENAVKKYKVPVLVSTKFVGGQTHMDIYGPGRAALEAGAIPTGNLTDVMAQVKFMWALHNGYKSFDELKEIINTSYVGEIN